MMSQFLELQNPWHRLRKCERRKDPLCSRCQVKCLILTVHPIRWRRYDVNERPFLAEFTFYEHVSRLQRRPKKLATGCVIPRPGRWQRVQATSDKIFWPSLYISARKHLCEKRPEKLKAQMQRKLAIFHIFHRFPYFVCFLATSATKDIDWDWRRQVKSQSVGRFYSSVKRGEWCKNRRTIFRFPKE